MFEDSVAELPSFWASINSWFTPTVLFLLLNLMIGIIALTSTLANQTKHHNQTQDHKLNLARSPSLLQRVRSINFYAHKQEHQQPNLGSTKTIAPDADTFTVPAETHSFFNFENTHTPEMLENPSHYMFDKEVAPQELENRFDYFKQQHQENAQVLNTQYDFEQTHQEISPEESSNHFEFDYFKQNRQEKGQVVNTQYEFEQPKDSSARTLDDNIPIESGSHHLNQESLKEVAEAEEEYFEDGDKLQSLEEVYSKVSGHHVSRTKSDTKPSSGEVTKKLRRRMKKSASMKSAFGHFEAKDIVETRRPATSRERGVAKVAEPDEEVDAKADDFINKFKQQLKLQRIDSITRYKEMVTRGSAK